MTGSRIPRRELPALLDAHREAMLDCRACGHHRNVVPIASDARRPRAMIVGQAPGITEAGGGKPFAGQAGRTLFRWFERAGFDEQSIRDDVYIAALTRCYPGRAPSGRGDRVPGGEEQERCSGWLDAELRIIQPPVLIPIGRLAIARFLGAQPLDQVVGRVHEVAHAGGTSQVIPLPHPSGASSWFHMPANARLLERALELIGAELRRIGVRVGGERMSAADRKRADSDPRERRPDPGSRPTPARRRSPDARRPTAGS